MCDPSKIRRKNMVRCKREDGSRVSSFIF
uniref:Uncharacterized protein n=1 Tax=Arundo donax TaxID=35708 RepID=A0A0A8Z6T7_ARUDO